MYKGIIFDLDGTLLDTLQGIAFAMNKVLAEHYDKPPFDVSMYRQWIGAGSRNLCSQIGIQRNIADIEQLLTEYTAVYEVAMLQHSPPFHGIPDLLEWLQDHSVPIAIQTNKQHDLAIALVAKMFPDIRFIDVVGLSAKYPKKPAPNAAIAVAKTMALEPSECLFVGDTTIDIKTAIAAQMTSVGVTWGYNDSNQLKEQNPTFIIDYPEQLIAFNALEVSKR